MGESEVKITFKIKKANIELIGYMELFDDKTYDLKFYDDNTGEFIDTIPSNPYDIKGGKWYNNYNKLLGVLEIDWMFIELLYNYANERDILVYRPGYQITINPSN